jgi:hypothetical protein
MKKVNWMDWWNVAEYTLATISDPNVYIRGTAPEWFEIHRGRAESAKTMLEELKTKSKEFHMQDAVIISLSEYEKLMEKVNE